MQLGLPRRTPCSSLPQEPPLSSAGLPLPSGPTSLLDPAPGPSPGELELPEQPGEQLEESTRSGEAQAQEEVPRGKIGHTIVERVSISPNDGIVGDAAPSQRDATVQ